MIKNPNSQKILLKSSLKTLSLPTNMKEHNVLLYMQKYKLMLPISGVMAQILLFIVPTM